MKSRVFLILKIWQNNTKLYIFVWIYTYAHKYFLVSNMLQRSQKHVLLMTFSQQFNSDFLKLIIYIVIPNTYFLNTLYHYSQSLYFVRNKTNIMDQKFYMSAATTFSETLSWSVLPIKY